MASYPEQIQQTRYKPSTSVVDRRSNTISLTNTVNVNEGQELLIQQFAQSMSRFRPVVLVSNSHKPKDESNADQIEVLYRS